MTTYIIPPTVLYILQHSVTKLKYFGKTTQDIRKYKGSGVYWTDHIKKHGKKHVVTRYVSKPYTDSDTISKRALVFSIRHNIAESKDWGNIKPENGLDGGGTMKGKTHSAETKQKISDAKKGKTRSAETKQKMADAKKGKPRSAETRQKISDAKKGISQPKVTCPHCGVVSNPGNMNRWHFDNCKSKPISLEGA